MLSANVLFGNGYRCELSTWSQMSPVPREELLRNIVGKDALFCALTDKIDAEVLDHAGPNLKVVATMSVGSVKPAIVIVM